MFGSVRVTRKSGLCWATLSTMSTTSASFVATLNRLLRHIPRICFPTSTIRFSYRFRVCFSSGNGNYAGIVMLVVTASMHSCEVNGIIILRIIVFVVYDHSSFPAKSGNIVYQFATVCTGPWPGSVVEAKDVPMFLSFPHLTLTRNTLKSGATATTRAPGSRSFRLVAVPIWASDLLYPIVVRNSLQMSS